MLFYYREGFRCIGVADHAAGGEWQLVSVFFGYWNRLWEYLRHAFCFFLREGGHREFGYGMLFLKSK